MLSSRKAEMTTGLVVTLVITLLVLFLLIVLFIKIGKGAEEKALESRCKNSVIAYAKLNSLPFGDAAADPDDIDCPPQFITIDERSDLKMKRQVANLMYNCWNNYGAGRLQLFSATDQKFCAVCSVFQFKDKKTELSGLTTFLMSERIPHKTKEGVRPTYYEYIAGVKTSAKVKDDAKQTDTNFLSGSARYVVLFTYYKQSYWSKVKGFIVGGLIGVATVVVAGAITVVSGGTAAVVAGYVAKVGFTAAITIGGAIGAGAAGGGVTTHGADWDTRLVMVTYDEKALKELGCEELPVSMVDKQFR